MRVLLATDGSEGAGIAADLVGNIHWPLGTSVEVVRVVGEVGLDVLMGPWPIGVPNPPDPTALEIQAAAEDLRAAVALLRERGLTADHAVLRGRPASALLEWIGRYPPDLVVVGTRGESTLTQALVGSVSAELVDHAPVPVLIARRPTLERVVVAVDGSDIADEAVATVCRWPFLADTTMRTLSVAPHAFAIWPDHLSGSQGYVPAVERVAAAAEVQDHDRIADAAAASLARVGFDVASEVRSGPPAPTIAAFAHDWDADLVILGSHGRTGLPRLLLGSVARSVLHHAGCSVLVVRRHPQPVERKRTQSTAMPWTIASTH